MIDAPLRRENILWRQRHTGRMRCDNRSRDESAELQLRNIKICQQTTSNREKASKILSYMILREHFYGDTLIMHFSFPGLWDNKFLLF